MTKITKKPFGIVEGQENFLYTLANGNTEVDIMSMGATIVSIRTADANGNVVDVVCGYDTVEDYISHGGYLGAVIGRNSNRIADAKFVLNGTTYQLYKNDGNNNLHGGKVGFDEKIWAMEDCVGDLVCHYTSPDGECGFPGEAHITVTYSLSDDNALTLAYKAFCDKDTVINLTNHTYFNLNGHESGSIVGHTMQINSDFYTPVDDNCCPTGEVTPVEGTVFDFRNGRVVADDIDNVPDFVTTAGYDHNFILKSEGDKMILATVAVGDKTGIKMETYTNKPAIQFYAGNMMDECVAKNGADYKKRQGFCLETQVCPNCHNVPHLGNAVVKKGELYSDATTYKFSV